MTTTIQVEGGNIFINSMPLETILQKVYDKGKSDALTGDEKITFQQLSKELKEKGRDVSVKTLTRKAREANVKVFQFDGKRNGCYKKDVGLFISY